jgi:circadian clock protein KaiB
MNPAANFKFRLFVAGNTPNSAKALANLKELCRIHLPDRHEIEVVDVFREPALALTEHVMMTPTLIKLLPSPVCKIIGTLSQTEPVLQILGLETAAE